MNSATYQLLNITCATVFCGGAGLILGYGWGRESAFEAVRKALIADEAVRISGFKKTFNAGVKSDLKTKKETSQKREAKI